MYKTNKHEIIVELFKNNSNTSFPATVLVDKFSDKMNKATIYRQLKSLESSNYISKTYNQSTKTYEYQLANDCKNHLHLKCVNCGRIIHLECHEAKLLIEHINNEHGFTINQYESTFYGLCKECK